VEWIALCPLAGPCEHGKELSGSINVDEFLD
jgi:hypothetical protein